MELANRGYKIREIVIGLDVYQRSYMVIDLSHPEVIMKLGSIFSVAGSLSSLKMFSSIVSLWHGSFYDHVKVCHYMLVCWSVYSIGTDHVYLHTFCLVLHLCGTMKELDVRISLLSVSSTACVWEYNMDTWISVQKRKGENSLVSIFLFWCDGYRRLPSDEEGLDTMECTLVHLNI